MLSKKIGVDLGSSVVLVYVKGEGVVVNEPAVAAADSRDGKVLAVGRAAKEAISRSESVRPLRPLEAGSLVDRRAASIILQHWIAQVTGRPRIFRPDIMLSVPEGLSGADRMVVLEASMQAGAKSAYLIDKPLAAALGAGIKIGSTRGIALANLGAGSTDLAVIAMGELLGHRSLAEGGALLDRRIAALVTAKSGLPVTEREAERAKIELGSALGDNDRQGIDLIAPGPNGARETVRVNGAEVRQAVEVYLASLVSNLEELLAETSADVRAFVQRNGLVLTGGAARLSGLSRFLQQRLSLPVKLAPDPQAAVAVGTGLALENLQLIRRGSHYIG
jgi:rod shape-determining protein MreB